MKMNLYVGNLPYTTSDEDLRVAFEEFGTVDRAQVIIDRDTGRSRGFGFVEMSSGGSDAVEQMNNADFGGRRLTVNEARPKEPRAATSGYSSGYRF